MHELTIIGGGLAGCEAAWQAAQRGIYVRLYEMRPGITTGAHTTANLAELVCSNSLGSNLVDRPSGLLKEELRCLNSLLLECASQAALPAGGALAVGRDLFSHLVTQRIESHPRITIIREEVQSIPSSPTIVASGPLTSPALAASIQQLTGEEQLFFFDAIAPIVEADSINMQFAFRASRYDDIENPVGDYINCPLTENEYQAFLTELLTAQRIPLKSFEEMLQTGVKAGFGTFFEACLPIEIIAQRGNRSLAFGPMRPVGLTNPRTGRWPYAVVQLRQDDIAGSLYNLVGFQTNLTYSEQERVFRMIPGLDNARFIRYGQMHRNTFLCSPKVLRQTLQFRGRSDLFFAGQITGVEGYMGNIATGLLAGWNAARLIKGEDLIELPTTTMVGALCYYVSHAVPEQFQPMKANFGILPPIEFPKRTRQDRAHQYYIRALADLDQFLTQSSEQREGE